MPIVSKLNPTAIEINHKDPNPLMSHRTLNRQLNTSCPYEHRSYNGVYREHALSIASKLLAVIYTIDV